MALKQLQAIKHLQLKEGIHAQRTLLCLSHTSCWSVIEQCDWNCCRRLCALRRTRGLIHQPPRLQDSLQLLEQLRLQSWLTHVLRPALASP